MAAYGLSTSVERVDGAPTEERASCLFLRRVTEERRRVSACFAYVAPPFPPPPPSMDIKDAADKGKAYHDRYIIQNGGTLAEPTKTSTAQWQENTDEARDSTLELIHELGESNPILRELLTGAVEELGAANGRRLMQRPDYNLAMTEALITHSVMTAYGISGIPGITLASCEALCEATVQDENAGATDQCFAYAFKRGAPFSYTDQTGRCWLLQNAGACKVQDFGVELLTRNIPSEQKCSALAPGLDNPACIAIPSTRDDARVLSHADAEAIAAQVPNLRYRAPGAGSLPMPRSTLEAMAMIAFARQEGIYSFWARSPNTATGDVTMHWPTQGGNNLRVVQGESRCIMISSGTGLNEKMYARFRQCDAKLAGGIVTVAAAAAPPPPPGDTVQHWYDPAQHPPPPPGVKKAGLEMYTRNEIQPRTALMCSGALEGESHQRVCMELAEKLTKFQPIFGVGFRAPFCEKICWHSCIGEGHTDGLDDGYSECKSVTCAEDSCLGFLLKECPPVLHGRIQSLYDGVCTIVPPSPPSPPGLPPSPPRPPASPPPHLPPPVPHYQFRTRDTETDSDSECELVSYDQCKAAVEAFAAANSGYLPVLRVSYAPCEGLEDEPSCFVGCSFGGKSGGSYRFLLPWAEEEFGQWNVKRCSLAMYPYCICANAMRKLLPTQTTERA